MFRKNERIRELENQIAALTVRVGAFEGIRYAVTQVMEQNRVIIESLAHRAVAERVSHVRQKNPQRVAAAKAAHAKRKESENVSRETLADERQMELTGNHTRPID